jgi:hypothetical protein
MTNGSQLWRRTQQYDLQKTVRNSVCRSIIIEEMQVQIQETRDKLLVASVALSAATITLTERILYLTHFV